MFKKRLNERLDERLRQARRDVDAVIDQLKEKSEAMAEKASLRAAINTGESGSARAEARAEIDRIVEDLRHPSAAKAVRPLGRTWLGRQTPLGSDRRSRSAGWASRASSCRSTATSAEIDVRGKRMRAKVKELRVIGRRLDKPKGCRHLPRSASTLT